jgi:hypothetical protein
VKRTRTIAVVVLALFIELIASAVPATAAVPADQTQITVSGSPLSGMAVYPLAMSPSFNSATQDYAVRCQTGVNNLVIALSARAAITVGTKRGTFITVAVALGENQAAVVYAPLPGSTRPAVRYWIRCLPHDFPVLQVNKAAGASAGWYLTGNVTTAADGSDAGYAMILDGNGTPVWYQATPGKAAGLQLLQPNVLAWAPTLFNTPEEAFSLYNLSTQTYTRVFAPTPPTDLHELLRLADGTMLIISAPLRTGIDLSSLPAPLNTTSNVIDCIVQRFDSTGRVLWQWSELDHSLLSEVEPYLSSVNPYGDTVGADIFHCNSIDYDPATGNVLVSARHENAVYLISGAADAHVIWKMGGTPTTKDATAKVLSIAGDTYNGFSGQHDARFQPGGDISLYDDRSKVSGPARGVQYHVDLTALTATLDFQLVSPDGLNSSATGSFRRYNNGTDNLVGWGFRTGSGFTEFDATGKVLLDLQFPNGDKTYRVLKVSRTAINADLLRSDAGLPRPIRSAVTWQSLGGQFVSGPAATSIGANRLDVFGRGADNQLYHRWWNGTTWTPWESLGGTLTSAPAAVAEGGEIDVFARGPDYGLWRLTWNGSAWLPWQPLGGTLAGAPGVASWAAGRLDVFARGFDDVLYHLWIDGAASSGWEGGEQLGPESPRCMDAGRRQQPQPLLVGRHDLEWS